MEHTVKQLPSWLEARTGTCGGVVVVVDVEHHTNYYLVRNTLRKKPKKLYLEA